MRWLTWYSSFDVFHPVQASLAMRMDENDRLVSMNIRLLIFEQVQNETVDEDLVFFASRSLGLGRFLSTWARSAPNHLLGLNAKHFAQLDLTFLTSRNALHFISLWIEWQWQWVDAKKSWDGFELKYYRLWTSISDTSLREWDPRIYSPNWRCQSTEQS